MDLHALQASFERMTTEVATFVQKLPGSSIALRYIQSSHQNDPVRSAVELALFLFALYYLLAPKYSTKVKTEVKFSNDEIEDLVDDWTPEPLTAPPTAFEKAELDKTPVICGPNGPRVKLQNGRTVTNLASYNFYNFNASEMLRTKALETLREYGVGPCGPPGFYGTQDVHQKEEADIAAHLGVSACIVYAQAFSTISSVIPTFCKRGDLIVADDSVNFAIRKGLQISRSTVKWYKHNDPADLERVLQTVVQQQKGKPLTRRFIITEGLFETVGDVVDLPKVVELKYKYKFRLILDETWSYGVLGACGRGVTEEQHVDPTSIDMIIGSLAGPLCASGGFCASFDEVVEHQRITAPAYTFSAAQPAILAVTASETIRILQESGDEIPRLRENTKALRDQLVPRSPFLHATSALENPVQLFVLKDDILRTRDLDRDEEDALLQECVDECLNQNVLISRLRPHPPSLGASHRAQPEWQPRPALRVCVTIGLSRKEMEKAGTVVRHAVAKVLARRK